MAGGNLGQGGFWTFFPYAMAVLGAAIGVLYINFGTQNGNPLIGLVIGLILGRLLAVLILRFVARS